MYLLPKADIKVPISENNSQSTLLQTILEKEVERNYALGNISEDKNRYLFVGDYSNKSFAVEEIVRFFPTTPINRVIFKPLFIKGNLDTSYKEVKISLQYPASNYISMLLLLLVASGLFYTIRSFFILVGSESFDLEWFNLTWVILIIYYTVSIMAFNLKVKKYKEYFYNLL